MICTFPRSVRYVANFQNLEIPATQSWLTNAELSELAFWKDNSRRRQWIAGRWIAKRLVSPTLQTEDLRRVEIFSRGTDGLGKSPKLTIDGISSPYRLSISHTAKSILVGIVRHDACIGVDVASNVPVNQSFRSCWFSDRELNWIEAGDPTRLPIAWALKESIFKACGEGCKWNPRSVELVEIEQTRVRSRVCGVAMDPLTMWVRATIQGVAAAVWSETATREVALCS